jgi:hypothetical protein
MSLLYFRKIMGQRGSGSARAVMEAVINRLRSFPDMQMEICQRFEPDFIRLGDALQAVAADADELTRQTVGTIGLLGKGEGGVMADVRQLAEQSLRELRGRTWKIEHSLQMVRDIFANLDQLATQAEFLQKLGLFLGVVGLNIGVESTRSAKSSGMFSGAAQEVRQLAAKIGQVATEIAADCELEQTGQQAVGDRITQSLTTLTGLAKEAELAVRDAVICIEEIMGKALATLAEANEHARAISSQIGEVVMIIQLHDSMNQRVVHIVKALTMVAETLNQADGQAQGDRLSRLAVARRFIDLQASQVKRLLVETEEADRNSRTAFQIIDQQVAALGHCFSVLSSAAIDERGSADQANPLFPLQEALDRLSCRLAEGSAMVDQLSESASQTSSMAGRLIGHMKNIETIRFEVHMKALNTIIMAAHLGDQGRTMEVLARETKYLSDRAHGFVSEVTSIHGKIAESIQALQLEDDSRASDNGRGGDLLGGSIGIIAETMSRFNQESAVARGQAEVLRQAIAKAGDGLEFLSRLTAELSDKQRQLAAIADFISPLVREVDSDLAVREGGRLETLYTMDKERKLHLALLGSSMAFQEAGEKTAERGGDLEHPFAEAGGVSEAKTRNRDDNVELF